MHLSQLEAALEVQHLLEQWVGRVSPPEQGAGMVSRCLMSDARFPDKGQACRLLLVADLLASVYCLVCCGGERQLYERLEELAQVSFLLARWHMPDHLQTKRSGGPWLQWMAVVVPACWLVLLWSFQLRGETSAGGEPGGVSASCIPTSRRPWIWAARPPSQPRLAW